jgi:hypothetical protein
MTPCCAVRTQVLTRTHPPMPRCAQARLTAAIDANLQERLGRTPALHMQAFDPSAAN